MQCSSTTIAAAAATTLLPLHTMLDAPAHTRTQAQAPGARAAGVLTTGGSDDVGMICQICQDAKFYINRSFYTDQNRSSQDVSQEHAPACMQEGRVQTPLSEQVDVEVQP